MFNPDSGIQYDLLIVGAGPAGLSAALQAHQRGLSFLVLEASTAIAATIQAFGRGKWIMAEPDQMPLRSPLNFRAGSREQLLRRWQQLCEQRSIPVRYNSRFATLEGEQDNYTLALEDGSCWRGRRVILAFGVQGKPTALRAKGVEQVAVHYQIPQQWLWQGEQIVVVGAGDSAIEDTLALAQDNDVLLLNRGNTFPKAKGANQRAIWAAIAEGSVRCLFNTGIEQLRSQSPGIEIQLPDERLLVDQLLVRIGTSAVRPLLEKLGVAFTSLDRNAQPLVDGNAQSSRAGLYLAGALCGQPLIKQAINQGFNATEHAAGWPAAPLEYRSIRQQLKTVGSRNKPELLHRWFEQRPLFRNCDSQTALQCLADSQLQRIDQRQTVIAEGEYVDQLIFIVSGAVAISEGGQHRATLGPGECFGEMALLSQQPSMYQSIARGGSLLLKVPKSALERLFTRFASARDRLSCLYLRRTLSWSLAPGTPTRLLDLLIRHSRRRRWQPGDTVIAAAGVPESMQLLVSGSCYSATSPYRFHDSGEVLALLETVEQQPLQQAIIAQTPCITLQIPISALQAIATLQPNFVDKVRRLHYARPQITPVTDNPAMVEFFSQQQLGNATDVLAIDKDLCTGCDNCEVACANTHGGVSRLNRKIGAVFENLHLPGSCRHCKEAACLQDCPADAINRRSSGEIDISDRCIGCGNCEANCPYDVIQIQQATQDTPWWRRIIASAPAVEQPARAVKCDLCHSRSSGPACVQACPTGAAQRLSPSSLIQTVSLE